MTDLNLRTEQKMSTREIAELTGKKHQHVLRDVDLLNENYIKLGLPKIKQGYYLHTNTGLQKHREYLLTKTQIFDLLNSYKNINIKASNKLEAIGYKIVRPEFIFGQEIINNLFSGYTVISQFEVMNKYKIDWYIKELNLAIEFDENHHIDSHDKLRQKEIENYLGCKFLRYKYNTNNHANN